MSHVSEAAPLDPLERRPEAGAFKIEDLLAEVRRGRIRIPHFQRALKWKREDASRFLDSIYRGYPVGTLLFWETDAPAATVTFGSVKLAGPESSNALMVVDGQQRLVSLVRTLLASEPAEDEFALFFDLDAMRFGAPPGEAPLRADPTRWIPLTVVLDSETLILWLLEKTPIPARRDAAIQLGKRLREYEIPAYTVRTHSEDVLREVFGRINTKGKQLSAGEVFDALNGSRSATKPGTLGHIAQELETLDFGRVEEKVIYRLLRVLQGRDVTERSGRGELRLGHAAAQEAYALTLDVLRQVVQFLKSDGGMPHYGLLPYKQPLVTLGKFFQHHREPRPRSRALLVRWLWRGALTGMHRGDTVSTRESLASIDASDEEASVQGMLRRLSIAPRNMTPAVGDRFNFRHAAGKLLTLALMDLQPRDVATRGLVDLPSMLSSGNASGEAPLVDIVSPAASLNATHTVANRLLHPRAIRLRSMLIDAPAPVLLSHGIDEAARSALVAGDKVQFLARRAAWLDVHCHSFFSGRARWDESDRPSMESLSLEEEA